MAIAHNDRFKEAPWYTDLDKESILIGGVGGIGSATLYCLSKTVPAKYFIYDNGKIL